MYQESATINRQNRDFSGGTVVKTLPSDAGVASSVLDQGAKIPHALWAKKQNRKQK